MRENIWEEKEEKKIPNEQHLNVVWSETYSSDNIATNEHRSPRLETGTHLAGLILI